MGHLQLDELREKCNTVVIDPPWPIPMAGKRVRRTTNPADTSRYNKPTKLPYKTMTIDEIKQIDLSRVANPGAHVYCWTTNKSMQVTFDVMSAWRVTPIACIPLVKPTGIVPCNGYVFASEFCVVGVFGDCEARPFHGSVPGWIESKRANRQHSVKPDVFYESVVQSVSPGPYCDIFARRQRDGWTVIGDEV